LFAYEGEISEGRTGFSEGRFLGPALVTANTPRPGTVFKEVLYPTEERGAATRQGNVSGRKNLIFTHPMLFLNAPNLPPIRVTHYEVLFPILHRGYR